MPTTSLQPIAVEITIMQSTSHSETNQNSHSTTKSTEWQQPNYFIKIQKLNNTNQGKTRH
jgi:hypothetical protein